MKISLQNGGKRFNREWIFRGANLDFISGRSYALTGPNGSGKSTFLQCLGLLLELSEGKLITGEGGKPSFESISFCAPYLDLIEEMSAAEFLKFHSSFKPLTLEIGTIIQQVGLEKAADRPIKNFSSGMKQRLKLAQAIFSKTSVLLLDEPCTNLDMQGIELYQTLMKEYSKDRLVVVSSNDPVEYNFCQEKLTVTDWKT